MNYDQLAKGYDPRNRIEEGYAYNPAQQQEKYNLGPSLEKHRQQGGVAREVQQFEKHLNALICVIDELDRRLAVATIPQPETNNSVQGADQSGSALACQLSSFNNMLSRQINRLEAIYQGVDL
jgi:hypothetical protein